MVEINLLPKEFVERQKLQQYTVLIILSVSIIVFATLIIFFSRVAVAGQISLQLSRIETDLRKLQSVVDEVNKLKSIKSTLESRKQLIEQLNATGLVYPKFMVDLVKILEDEIWLTSMNTTTEYDSNRLINRIKVTLSCNTYNKFAIADFVTRLEKSDKFKDIRLDAISISHGEKYSLYTFNIDFTYIVK